MLLLLNYYAVIIRLMSDVAKVTETRERVWNDSSESILLNVDIKCRRQEAQSQSPSSMAMTRSASWFLYGSFYHTAGNDILQCSRTTPASPDLIRVNRTSWRAMTWWLALSSETSAFMIHVSLCRRSTLISHGIHVKNIIRPTLLKSLMRHWSLGLFSSCSTIWASKLCLRLSLSVSMKLHWTYVRSLYFWGQVSALPLVSPLQLEQLRSSRRWC